MFCKGQFAHVCVACFMDADGQTLFPLHSCHHLTIHTTKFEHYTSLFNLPLMLKAVYAQQFSSFYKLLTVPCTKTPYTSYFLPKEVSLLSIDVLCTENIPTVANFLFFHCRMCIRAKFFILFLLEEQLHF